MVVFFFRSTELIIRLAAEGSCGKIVADDGGTVFDPVPFTALEPSARPTSPRRRVESSVRTGGRSRICGLASTFFSRCHKQKIGPKKKLPAPHVRVVFVQKRRRRRERNRRRNRRRRRAMKGKKGKKEKKMSQVLRVRVLLRTQVLLPILLASVAFSLLEPVACATASGAKRYARRFAR